jgi:tetratricopeptide (TPR) repeat protein
MSDANRCPDCGHVNPPGADHCAACNYPLVEAHGGAPSEAGPTPATRQPAAAAGRRAASAPAPAVERLRPIRPRRPRPANNVALQLWLGLGAFFALLLVFIAVQANMQRGETPVEGSSVDQQKRANELMAAVQRDSTDLDARNQFADILFDTGNWSEAIVHYRSVVRQDSSRVPAIVDLGVCYYNLSKPAEAERMFQLALRRDPHHPFALFNLGIVHERRDNPDKALEFFHRALQSAPPENMRPAILEAMQRVQQKSGRDAQPLEQPRQR